MKYAIAVVFMVATGTAASAQSITVTPNPGQCLGNRCGYVTSDGATISPSPNGGYVISRPPPPPPPIVIPRIRPYQPYGGYNGYGGYNNQDDDDQ
jgi:hypothetical protein